MCFGVLIEIEPVDVGFGRGTAGECNKAHSLLLWTDTLYYFFPEFLQDLILMTSRLWVTYWCADQCSLSDTEFSLLRVINGRR